MEDNLLEIGVVLTVSEIAGLNQIQVSMKLKIRIPGSLDSPTF